VDQNGVRGLGHMVALTWMAQLLVYGWSSRELVWLNVKV